MKKIKIIVIILAGSMGFYSCSDFLDLKPISEVGSNGFYSNDEQMEAGVIAIYDGMQTMVQTEYALTEIRSDNSKTRLGEGEGGQFESMNVSPSNGTVSDYWTNNYNIIFRANTILEHLDVVSTTTKKNQYEGEAKFARAMCNFNLVRTFGDVPLITKVINSTDVSFFARKPTTEVYTSIISDLTDAANLLSGRSGIGEGRATSGAANALLAKVYLTTGNYTKATSALNAVSTTDYSLITASTTAYHDVFYSERNKEIIFAVQFIADNSVESELFSIDFTSKGRATGLNFPTNNLQAVVDASDKRKSTLFYTEPTVNYLECGKYISSSTNSSYGGNDWIILRYADVLLMKVEAIMAGNTTTSDPTAVGYFNQIRTRAGLSTLSTITKDDLLKERRIEFAFEDQRLYDLIRFGKADEVMGAFSTQGEPSFTYSSTALLLPIPQREINLYPSLTQNPGYN